MCVWVGVCVCGLVCARVGELLGCACVGRVVCGWVEEEVLNFFTDQ